MSDNAARLWIQDTQNQVAIKQAAAAIERTGNALPCRVTAVNGSIVTVAFEVNAAPWTLPSVTLPKAESRWIRAATQVGDYGLTIPADVYIGGISGLGGGVADTKRRGNLTALVWLPVANVNFPAVDPNSTNINGPSGVVIQDEGGNTILTINNSGTVTIKAAHTIIHTLPTSPGVTGELWNNSGAVSVS